jgi:hypothetical protein
MNRFAAKAVLAIAICLPLTAGVQRAQAAEDTSLVEALGGLSAAYVYQTYLNIGMIGDSVAGKSMEPATGKELLGSVLRMADTINTQLTAVAKNDKLSADDQKTMQEFLAIITLLKTQGKELELMWSTKDEAHAKKYESARTLAWDKIKTTLGIKD